MALSPTHTRRHKYTAAATAAPSTSDLIRRPIQRHDRRRRRNSELHRRRDRPANQTSAARELREKTKANETRNKSRRRRPPWGVWLCRAATGIRSIPI